MQSTWDAARDHLRLDYAHGGLAEVEITGGGAPAAAAADRRHRHRRGLLARVHAAGPALVQGGYLVRTAAVQRPTLALTGDTASAGPLTVWAPSGVSHVTWNGQPVATTAGRRRLAARRRCPARPRSACPR